MLTIFNNNNVHMKQKIFLVLLTNSTLVYDLCNYNDYFKIVFLLIITKTQIDLRFLHKVVFLIVLPFINYVLLSHCIISVHSMMLKNIRQGMRSSVKCCRHYILMR